MSHSVTLYAAETCSWCVAVKEYLQAREIDFEQVDVSADPASAEEMVRKTGQMGVPVLDIDGNMVIGFNKSEIDQLLGLV